MTTQEEDDEIARMVDEHKLILNVRGPGEFNKGAIISQLNSYVSTASNVEEFKKNIEANYNLNHITGLLKSNPVNNTPLSDDDLEIFFNWLKKACAASSITVAASSRTISPTKSVSRHIGKLTQSASHRMGTQSASHKTKKGGRSHKKSHERLRKNKSKKVRRT